jgi:hypothetical protein
METFVYLVDKSIRVIVFVGLMLFIQGITN